MEIDCIQIDIINHQLNPIESIHISLMHILDIIYNKIHDMKRVTKFRIIKTHSRILRKKYLLLKIIEYFYATIKLDNEYFQQLKVHYYYFNFGFDMEWTKKIIQTHSSPKTFGKV